MLFHTQLWKKRGSPDAYIVEMVMSFPTPTQLPSLEPDPSRQLPATDVQN